MVCRCRRSGFSGFVTRLGGFGTGKIFGFPDFTPEVIELLLRFDLEFRSLARLFPCAFQSFLRHFQSEFCMFEIVFPLLGVPFGFEQGFRSRRDPVCEENVCGHGYGWLRRVVSTT